MASQLQKYLDKIHASSGTNSYVRDTFDVSDPNIKTPTNQIDYYTNQLQQNNIAPEKPSFLKSALGVGGKALEILTSPLNALYSGVMHGANNAVQSINEGIKRGEDPFTANAKALPNILKGVGQGVYGGLLSPYSESARKHNQGLVDVIDSLSKSSITPEEKLAESLTTKTGGYGISKLLGANEESARNWGKLSADFEASLAVDPLNYVSGLGAATKAISGGTKAVEGAKDIATLDKSINAIRKSEGLDKLYDFSHDVQNTNKYLTSEDMQNAFNAIRNEGKGNQYLEDVASKLNGIDNVDAFKTVLGESISNIDTKLKPNATYMLNKAQKVLGTMPEYEGIKFFGNTVVSKEALMKLGDTKWKYPAMAIGTVLNPAGTIYASASPLGKLIRKTKAGEAFADAFTGGKNATLKKLARENPETLLDTLAQESKDSTRYGDKLMNKEAAMAKVASWNKADLSEEELKNITKSVETPYSKSFTKMFKKEDVLNPEYLIQAAYYNKGQINRLQKEVQPIINEFDSKITELQKTGVLENAGKLSELLAKRTEYAHAIEFAKQMYSIKSVKFMDILSKMNFFDDTALSRLPMNLLENPDMIMNMSKEEVAKLIQDLTGATDKEALKKAEQLKLASDVLKNNIDEIMPGYSSYFTGTSKGTIGQAAGSETVRKLDLSTASDKELENAINDLRQKNYMKPFDSFSGMDREKKENLYKSLNKTSENMGAKEEVKVSQKTLDETYSSNKSKDLGIEKPSEKTVKNIRDLVNKLHFPKLSDTEEKILSTFSKQDAEEFEKRLSQQYAKRRRLTKTTMVYSAQDNGKFIPSTEAISELEHVTGVKARIATSNENVPEAVRLIELGRLRRAAAEDKSYKRYIKLKNKGVTDKGAASLADIIATRYGKSNDMFKYLINEKAALANDLKYLQKEELQQVLVGATNRGINPYLHNMAKDMFDNGRLVDNNFRNDMMNKLKESLDMQTIYKKTLSEEQQSAFDKAFESSNDLEYAINKSVEGDKSFADNISVSGKSRDNWNDTGSRNPNQAEASKKADEVLSQIKDRHFATYSHFLNKQTDDVLVAALYKKEAEMNILDKGSTFDSLTHDELVSRLKNDIHESSRMSEKQYASVQSALENALKKDNRFYKEIQCLTGGEGADLKKLTKYQAADVFKLVHLDASLKDFMIYDRKGYDALVKSGRLDDITSKYIEVHGRQNFSDVLDGVSKQIDAGKGLPLDMTKQIYFKQQIGKRAQKLWGIAKNSNSTEWMDYANKIQNMAKDLKLNTYLDYEKYIGKIGDYEKAVKNGVPLESKLRKLISGESFNASDLQKTLNTLNFTTPKGVLKLDSDMSPKEMQDAIKGFESSNMDNISSNITTTITPKLNNAGIAGKNVVASDTGALTHEYSHIAFDGSKGNGDRTANALKTRLQSLGDAEAQRIADVLGTSVDSVKNGFISDYAASVSGSKRDINQEMFAELSRAIFKDSSIKDVLGSDVTGLWERTIEKTPAKDLSSLIPSSAKDSVIKEYTEKLDKIKSILNFIDDSKVQKYDELTSKINEFKEMFGDNNKLLENFEKNMKNKGFKVPKFKSLEREVQGRIYTANVKGLSDTAKQVRSAIVEDFKHIGIEEGFLTTDDISGVSDYFTHMLNPNLKDEKGFKGIASKMGIDLGDPYNIFDSRKLKGTIEKINKYMYDKHGIEGFFETNALKVYLMRALKHEDIMYKQKMVDDVMNIFSHKIMKDSELNSMSLSDLKYAADKYGFSPVGADIPNHYDRTHKYVGEKTIGTEHINPGDTVTNYEMTPESGSQLKQMYINGYKKWIEDKLGNNHIRVTYNRQFERKQIRTVSDEAVQNANEVHNDMRNDLRSVQSALDSDRASILQYEIDRPIVPIDPKDMKYKNIYEPTNEDVYLVPKRAIEHYDETVKASFKQDKNAMLDMYDKFMGAWKAAAVTSPGFHVNNAIGNVLNSYLEIGGNVLDPKMNWIAHKIKQSITNGTELKGNFAGKSLEEIKNEMQRRDLLDAFFTADFQQADDYINSKAKNLLDSKKPKILRKLAGDNYSYNPLSSRFALYKANQKIGSRIEQQSRIVNFLTHVKAGSTYDEAADLTNKVMFDYTDLTKFESNVMKRIAPFYTFMRKNVPLQIEKMTYKPEFYSKMYNLYNGASKTQETDEDKMLKPDNYNQMLPIGDSKYLNIALPALDVNKVVSPMDLWSSQNPLTKLAAELATGKNTFTGGDIKNPEQYAMQALLPSTKGIRPPVKISEINKPLRQRQLLYDYLTKLQSQYYDAKANNGIINKGQVVPSNDVLETYLAKIKNKSKQ